MTAFENAITYWTKFQTASLQFGYFAWDAVEKEGHTIRELSIAICGNAGLEDKIGRLIMAAKWDTFIHYEKTYSPLYEDAHDWLSVSHFTELWKLYDAAGDEDERDEVMDAFEQCFIRDAKSQVTEIRPVEWLRAKRQGKEKSYLDKVKSYCNHIVFDLIETPLVGLISRSQMDAAADVRENAKRLQESLQTLLSLIEAESEK